MRKSHGKSFEELREIYKKKKMTRRQICEKYGVGFDSFSASLRRNKIDIWDYELNIKKNNGKSKSPFYHWKNDKSDYARLFYEFNK
jgi:transcriptional regulator with XRE-family HTH domain